MRTVFADSFYYFALLSSSDRAHDTSHSFTQQFTGRIVTTEWVLTEVADGLSSRGKRFGFAELNRELADSPQVSVVASSPELFRAGISLYLARPDKDWTLTDCISFVVMQREELREALTGDRHFEQAGFLILL